MTKKNPHDQLFQKALENPMVAYEFLNTHLPDYIKKKIDLTTLQLEKTLFVDQHLDKSACDVLFKANFDGQVGYLYILAEHQSSNDYWMAFRVHKYIISILSRHQERYPKDKYLPVVYPLVFYNGLKSYTAPLSFWDLFADSHLAKEVLDRYRLINVHSISDDELKQRMWSGLMEFFMKHIHERNLLQRWREVADLFPKLVQMSSGYNHIELVLHYTLTKIDESDKIELYNLLSSKLTKETGDQLMTSLAQHWKDEGIQIGEQKGIQIGQQRGKAEGIQIGEQKGMERGKIEGKVEVARNLLTLGMKYEQVAGVTGLSIKEIKNLAKA